MLIEKHKDEKPTAVLSRNCIVALCQYTKWSTDKSQWRSIQPGGDRTVLRLKNKSKRNLDNLKKYRQKNFLCLGDHRLAKLFRTPPPTEEALCLHYSNLKIYAHIFPHTGMAAGEFPSRLIWSCNGSAEKKRPFCARVNRRGVKARERAEKMRGLPQRNIQTPKIIPFNGHSASLALAYES